MIKDLINLDNYLKMPTTTITLGDQGENHAGMEKIGKMASCGLSIETLKMMC